MATSFNPAQTGNSRVFIIEGRARADHRPDYQSSVKAGSPSQGFGDEEIMKLIAELAEQCGASFVKYAHAHEHARKKQCPFDKGDMK
jgi:hypothetical protein